MQESRREFIKKATLLTGAAGLFSVLPPSIQRALAIEADPGTTFLDAEHVVFLMQENRSFDHCYGTLKGVRGFNDPRALQLPNGNPVWLQTNEEGKTYAPFRLDIKNSKATWMGSLPHSWSDQVDARNHGKFDTWLLAKKAGNPAYAHMPLTMGYYDRNDIPFYYALADAFTVCDQHFCSSLTGTSANRSYFWSGTIREKPHDENSMAHVWNGEINYKDVSWMSFPERLEKAGVSWKVYQNELSVPVGFEDEEEGWLANFTDNNLEFFKQYHVGFHPPYMQYAERLVRELPAQIKKLEDQLKLDKGIKKLTDELEEKKRQLEQAQEARKKFTKEKFDSLTDFEKNIHRKAFVTNVNDPDYHKLSTLVYDDGGVKREVKVPKGDIFHQFRADTDSGNLPTVSWLVAPCNFSDHPGAPWYGAWYVSEALDILTRNPDVWKKTIFILTYDENDGYFDHVPPFIPPQTGKAHTGAVSEGIDTRAEWVTMEQENARGGDKAGRRESPIGLGYRVPLVVASPWSRGGYVNSQVFDLTSSLMFLETFIKGKTGKPLKEDNITNWRRTVCGDLTSVFRPFNNEKINYPSSLERDNVIKAIYDAKFKAMPGNFKALSVAEIEAARHSVSRGKVLPSQEPGVKEACPIPYELYVDASLDPSEKILKVNFKAGAEAFGQNAVGAAFNVYSPAKFSINVGAAAPVVSNAHNWAFAVKPGDTVPYSWPLNAFEDDRYHLKVYSVNGFYREFSGSQEDPGIEATMGYEKTPGQNIHYTGNLLLTLKNVSKTQDYMVFITDNGYGAATFGIKIPRGRTLRKVIDLKKSFGWYDLSIKVKGSLLFEARYAGHVETGKASVSDPLMGGVAI